MKHNIVIYLLLDVFLKFDIMVWKSMIGQNIIFLLDFEHCCSIQVLEVVLLLVLLLAILALAYYRCIGNIGEQ